MMTASVAHSSSTQVGRSAVLHLGGVGLGGIMSLALTVGIARTTGYDDLGVYTLGLGAMVLTALVTRMGLDSAVLQFTARHAGAGDLASAAAFARRALWWSGLAGLAGALALMGGAELAAGWLAEPRLKDVLPIFAAGVPLYSILMVAAAALRGRREIGWAVLGSQVLLPAGTLLGAAATLPLFPDVRWAAWSTVGALTCGAALMLGRVMRTFGGPVAPVTFGPFLGFGLVSALIQLLNQVIYWFAAYAMAYYADASAVGFYRAAAHAAMPFTLVVDGFAALYVPLSGTLLANADRLHLAELTQRVARLTFFLTALVAVPTLIAPESVLAPFGKNIGPAIPSFVILVGIHAAAAALGPVSWLLITGERLGWSVAAKLPGLVLGAATAAFLVPTWGITGAAAGTAVAILSTCVLHLWFVRRLFGIDAFSKHQAVMVVAAVLATGGGVGLVPLGVPSLGAAVFAAATFTIVSWKWGITEIDRRVLRDIVELRPSAGAAALTR